MAAANNGNVTVKICVFHEIHTHGECKRVDLCGVTIKVFAECDDKLIEPQPTPKETSPGHIELCLPAGSVVRLVPMLAAGDPALYTPVAKGFLIKASGECTIPIAYYSSPAEVKASACSCKDDQDTNPVPLPNVKFKLHRGIGVASDVLQALTTSVSSTDAVFEGLESGYYTLVAEMPSQENYQPRRITRTFYACEGQCVDLGSCFRFKAVTGAVTATVTDGDGTSIPCVPLLLVGPNQVSYSGKTGDCGTATFSNVPVGTYTLRLAETPFTDQTDINWIPATPPPSPVTVGPSEVLQAAIVLHQDIPRIHIEVTDTQGNGQANAVVEIYDATKKYLVDTVVLDASGKRTWIAPSDEVYYIALKPTQGGPPARMYATNGQSGS